MVANRQPVLAGTWYPGDRAGLAAAVDAFLVPGPEPAPAGQPLVALAPHAGYAYSGPTAGRLFAVLRDSLPQRVVIMAPNHRAAPARIALSGAAAYVTPLGKVPVDTVASASLAGHPSFMIDDRAHAEEHAVEIQLPFLQRIAPANPPSIVPMLVPCLPAAAAKEAAVALGEICGPDTLLLVSTDLTHYGAAYGYLPFTSDVPAAIERLDTGALLRFLAGDAAGLRAYGRETGITMCGLEAAALALQTGLPTGHEGALLDYSRSADREGDWSMSVSYAAALLGAGKDH